MKIMAIICSAIISITSMLGNMVPIGGLGLAMPIGTLPYVPPSTGQIFDLISNMYGVTAPDIEDEAQKVEAYWNLYRYTMGAGFDAFKDDLQEIIDNAKTSRKLVFTSTISNNIQAALGVALQEGISLPTEEDELEGIDSVVARINTMNVYNGNAQVIQIVNKVWNHYGNGSTKYFAVLTRRDSTTFWFTLVSYPSSWGLVRARYVNGTVGMQFTNQSNASSKTYYTTFVCSKSGDNYYVNSALYTGAGTAGDSWSDPIKARGMDPISEVKSVSAQSQAVATAIQNQTYVPITADTYLDNGSVDMTKPVTVNLPTTLPKPAKNVSDLEDVQEDLGVLPLPLTEDVAQTIAQLQEQALAKYGDTSEYALDLTRYFPFCLPFDLARILQAFVAEPEAPSFSYTINNPFSEEPEKDITLEIDLSVFDDVAVVLRTLESILFVVGLAVVTRSLYLRG